MAVRKTRVDQLAEAINTELQRIRGEFGMLTNLTTADKANLVAAVNAINASHGPEGGVPPGGWTESTLAESIVAKLALATTASQVGHTHAIQDILSVTALGSNILKAANAVDARALIGAGTSSLIIGTTGTTAKAGNYVPDVAGVTGLQTALDKKATLGADGKIVQSEIGAQQMIDWLGQVGSQAAMLALVGQRGDWCHRTDLGTEWQLIGEPSSSLGSWMQKVYPASPVSSVNGRQGAVTTSTADITDAGTVGRLSMKAADAAAGRAAIGAGTGNGTSNLALGVTSSTALRGDAIRSGTALPGTGDFVGQIFFVRE